MSAFRNLFTVLVLLLAACSAPTAADAETTPAAATAAEIALPDPLTPEAINALVSRLTDEQVRQMLLQRLDADARDPAPPTTGDGSETIPDLLADTMVKTVSTIAYNVRHTPEYFAEEASLLSRYFSDLGTDRILAFFGVFALAIALGIAAEILVYRFLIPDRFPAKTDTTPESIFDALPLLTRRLWREIAGAFAVFISATIVLRLLMPEAEAPVAHIIARWLIFLPRIVVAILRFFLAPHRPDVRLVHTDDWTARYLFRNFVAITLLIGIALALVSLNAVLGAPPGQNRVAFALNLLVFIWLGVIVMRTRTGLKSIIRGRQQNLTPYEIWASNAYPDFALVVIFATWCFAAVAEAVGAYAVLQGGRHLISLAVLLLAPLLDTVIRAVVLHIVPPMRGGGHLAQKAYDANLRSYTRMGRVVVFGAVILVTARLWDITLLNVASAGVGEKFAGNLIQALLILVCGYLLWEVVRLVINRRLANEQTAVADGPTPDDDAPHPATGPSSRLGTVLPPVSWTLQAVVIILTVLTALGNLGIDVTPLLAGAGIAGIAIGFGAQKLVSDVMSGLFFLVDDAFRLNEYIDVGGTQGTVEKISLRSLQLRDAKGPILCIPYSNIKTVTNFGRDWGIMKLKFTVPFDTDIEKVRKIFKKIGQEMMQDPLLAPGFIEPFKSQGVGEFNDVGIVVRGKFVHHPGAQFPIRKQIFKRVQEEFAANGIPFARREVRVSVSGDGAISEEVIHAAGGAAAESVAVQERAAAAAAKA